MEKVVSGFRWVLLACVAIGYAGLVGCALNEELDPRTENSGGDATIHNKSKLAFSLSIPNLTREQIEDFTFGNRLFNTNWVIAPSSTSSFDGLGATFNRVSCSSCHLRDGRGKPPESDKEMMDSMLIRLSIPGSDEHGGPKHHPAYGDQLQDRALPGIPPEGFATVSYTEIHDTFADGTSYALRRPTYHFHNMGFGELDKNILFSPRVAEAVFGTGLLEIVPEAELLEKSDPDDRDGDGISGRANRVWNVETGRMELGRFGWKANQPTLRQQISAALNGDIGITNPVFPNENCPTAQTECRNAQHGGTPELSEAFLQRLTNYNRTLAVPAARDLEDAEVKRGEKLFYQANCTACHTPTLHTGESDITQLAHQIIHPFTDMLLHDMGEGLADHRPDFTANGNEWRTAPLWGLGLIKTVNGHTNLLHDGRARDAQEAIIWHDGEARAAKEAFRNMNADDRKALLRFLNSL